MIVELKQLGIKRNGATTLLGPACDTLAADTSALSHLNPARGLHAPFLDSEV